MRATLPAASVDGGCGGSTKARARPSTLRGRLTLTMRDLDSATPSGHQSSGRLRADGINLHCPQARPGPPLYHVLRFIW